MEFLISILIVAFVIVVMIIIYNWSDKEPEKELEKRGDNTVTSYLDAKEIDAYLDKRTIEGLIRENYNLCNYRKVLDTWDKYKNLGRVPLLQFMKDLGFRREGVNLIIFGGESKRLDRLVKISDLTPDTNLRKELFHQLSVIVARYLIFGLDFDGVKYINSTLLTPNDKYLLVRLVMYRLHGKVWSPAWY